MKKNYSKLEQSIIQLFQSEKTFFFHDKPYEVDIAGKPRPQSGGGEVKTDVYIRGKNEEEEDLEIKISVKMKNTNEWQESKVTKERAEAIFGEGWQRIIQDTTLQIQDKFLERPLLFKDGKGTTKKDSVTMGWRLEVTNKPRNLSAKISLPDDKIKDFIYMGKNLPKEKRDGIINGKIIENSGIAEYILYINPEEVTSTKNIMEHLIPIREMIVPPTYLTFIANNYRMKENKIDGSRPLAVFVEWQEKSGKIHPNLRFDQPLEQKGKLLVPAVRSLFEQLQLATPSDISVLKHITNPSLVFEKEQENAS